VAFATSLNRITGKRTNGEQTDVWVRATIGFAKKDRRWKATHEHFSVPIYMDGSYKPAVDLKPRPPRRRRAERFFQNAAKQTGTEALSWIVALVPLRHTKVRSHSTSR
jgi:SnoaL-like domain